MKLHHVWSYPNLHMTTTRLIKLTKIRTDDRAIWRLRHAFGPRVAARVFRFPDSMQFSANVYVLCSRSHCIAATVKINILFACEAKFAFNFNRKSKIPKWPGRGPTFCISIIYDSSHAAWVFIFGHVRAASGVRVWCNGVCETVHYFLIHGPHFRKSSKVKSKSKNC